MPGNRRLITIIVVMSSRASARDPLFRSCQNLSDGSRCCVAYDFVDDDDDNDNDPALQITTIAMMYLHVDACCDGMSALPQGCSSL